MSITIEMIEQVLEATNADYRMIKQALIDADGDVDKAIEAIRSETAAEPERSIIRDPAEESAAEAENEEAEVKAEETEEGTEEKAEETESGSEEESEGKTEKDPMDDWSIDEFAEKMIDRLKKRIEEGNVDRIRISREGTTILNIPLGLGIIGGLFSIATVPWAVILGILTAMGLNCKVEIITKDGDSEEM